MSTVQPPMTLPQQASNMRSLSVAAMEASDFSGQRLNDLLTSGTAARSQGAGRLAGSHAMLQVVNGALALEYALKAIYIYDRGRPPRIHELGDIARKLSAPTRDMLSDEFELQLSQAEIAETHIQAAVISDHAGVQLDVPRGFEQTLATWSSTFKTMRYHYERSDHRATHSYLGPLFATLHRHIERVAHTED